MKSKSYLPESYPRCQRDKMFALPISLSLEYRTLGRQRGSRFASCNSVLICSISFCSALHDFTPRRKMTSFLITRYAVCSINVQSTGLCRLADRLAAIHGRPYGMWDNVPSANGTEDNGYCVHVSNLLLPWHRPYLALFEQLLFEHMTACAEEFPAGPLRQRYARAATQVILTTDVL